MIKLTKTQRDQLIAVAMGAVAVMAALWYFVVLVQGRELAATRASSAKMSTKLKDASAVTGKILAEKSDSLVVDVGYTALVIPRAAITA